MDRTISTRRAFLKVIGLGAASSVLPGCASLASHSVSKEVSGKPNIVFIMADDMGYGDVGCNGSTKIPTPNIDRLASLGIRFTDAHTPSAVCTPTRYGVLTGRYCWRTRLKSSVATHWEKPLIEPERMTLASMLKSQGYATGCFGKWHLGLGWQPKTPGDNLGGWGGNGDKIDFTQPFTGGPLELGFDQFFGIGSSNNMFPYCFLEKDRTVGIPSLPKDPHYDTEGARGLMTPGFKSEEIGPRIAEKAVEFIESHHRENPKQPFFLYLPASAPHRPCVPPAFAKGKSQAGNRGDMVYEFDWTVGQVMKTLDQLGLTDNTLIIVTSDNGAHAGDLERFARPGVYNADEKLQVVNEKGRGPTWITYGHLSNGEYLGYKSQIWDGGHRVPFIAKWPGHIRPATTSDELICLTDILATCASVVGERLPEEAGEDSYNILPALLGKKRSGPIREAIVHHSSGGKFSIRQGDWKLVLCKGHGGWYNYKKEWLTPWGQETEGQLYNMKEDRSESVNLYEKHPEVVERLTKLLEKYQSEPRSAPRV
jgi:arylsulfatase A